MPSDHPVRAKEAMQGDMRGGMAVYYAVWAWGEVGENAALVSCDMDCFYDMDNNLWYSVSIFLILFAGPPKRFRCTWQFLSRGIGTIVPRLYILYGVFSIAIAATSVICLHQLICQ